MNGVIDMAWNKKLKALRGGKTVDEVSNDLQLNPNCYEAYESGERIPLPTVKQEIAKYFSVTVKDIWG